MTKAELYQKACMLPLLPGVYIIRDKSDTIIYIGKAKRLRIRVSQYFREGVPHDNKVSQMIAHAYAFDVIVCQSEFEALVLEASQIKAHTPKYNILLKDDKGGRGGVYRPLHLQLCRTADGRNGYGCLFAAALLQALPAGDRQRPSLPERPHRQVHGGVQRKNKLRDLQSGGQKRGAPHPLRQKGYPENPQRADAGGLRPAGI